MPPASNLMDGVIYDLSANARVEASGEACRAVNCWIRLSTEVAASLAGAQSAGSEFDVTRFEKKVRCA